MHYITEFSITNLERGIFGLDLKMSLTIFSNFAFDKGSSAFSLCSFPRNSLVCMNSLLLTATASQSLFLSVCTFNNKKGQLSKQKVQNLPAKQF